MLPPLVSIPPQIAAVGDYADFARERMSENAWAYLTGGAADEITLLENTTAFSQLRLHSRVLSGLKHVDTRLSLLGTDLPFPILLAPVAFQKLAHPDGELATALGAAALEAGMVLSSQSSTLLESVAQAGAGPKWFQLYWQADREIVRSLITRAETAGYRAIVLTVDAPVHGIRNREQRARFQLPDGVRAINLPPAPTAHSLDDLLAAAPTWNDIEWLCFNSPLPVILKGVLHPADALQAAECGVAGVIVSNHGGRTLDTLPATIHALPAIVKALDGHLPVLLDSGIRRGTDVFKALALGASAVLIGRPYMHGLAAAGAVGVAHVLKILHHELQVTMALTGRGDLTSIDGSAIF